MIVPNKAVSYEKSLISKFPLTLQILADETIPVAEFYHRTKSIYNDINQFILALDTLYILGKISLVDGGIKRC